MTKRQASTDKNAYRFIARCSRVHQPTHPASSAYEAGCDKKHSLLTLEKHFRKFRMKKKKKDTTLIIKLVSFQFWYTRGESNPNRRNRNPIFYPLNYGCISDLRHKNTIILLSILMIQPKNYLNVSNQPPNPYLLLILSVCAI